ncbi:MAG TPA: hydrolase [Fibrobacteres bacterium]|jgi:nicotinamidase-related amidase|nr:hydrolase [Fibrobacterota bacterium]
MEHLFLLSREGTVLLVLDVQEKCRKIIPRFDAFVGNIIRLILTFQMYDMPIIVTEQYPEGLGGTVRPVRNLFSFLEIVEKIEFAATDNPHFWAQVNAIKPHTVVVCGFETHVCVSHTVIRLLEKGMQVHVVADAVNSRLQINHNVALKKMEKAGANITTTEMCMLELTGKGGTPEFRNILRMIKGRLKIDHNINNPPTDSKPAEAEKIDNKKNGAEASREQDIDSLLDSIDIKNV